MSTRVEISPGQLTVLFIISRTVPPAVALVTIDPARRDAWLAILIASLCAVVVLMPLLLLGARFPDQTLAQYTQTVFGKPVGKALSLVYIWFFLHIAAINARQMGDIMTSIIPETPLMVFMATLIFVAVVVARGNIETICRFANLALPVLAGLTFTVFALASPQIQLENLLPFMEDGAKPVIKGGLVTLVLFSEIAAFGMIYPNLNRKNRAFRAMAIYIAVSGALLSLLSIAAVGIFGSLAFDLRFPVYYVARIANVGDFLQRLEGFAVAVWVVGYIVKISIFLYCASLGLSHVLGVPDHKPFATTLGLFVALLGIVIAESVFELSEFFRPAIVVPYALSIEFVLPLITLAAAVARRRRSPLAARSGA